MSKFTVQMVKERQTKNTWRYTESGDAPLIGTLYIPKIVLKTKFGIFPQEIEVTIESK